MLELDNFNIFREHLKKIYKTRYAISNTYTTRHTDYIFICTFMLKLSITFEKLYFQLAHNIILRRYRY